MTIFFEGALLPGTEAGRARVSSRTAHILPKRERESTAGANSTPTTRDQDSILCITSRNYHQSKSGNPNRRSSNLISIASKGWVGESRNKHGYGYGKTGGLAPNWRPIGQLSPKLETDFQRPLDSRHRFRIQDGISRTPTAKSRSNNHSFGHAEVTDSDTRGEGSSRKRSYPEGSTQQGGVYKSPVPGAKVRRFVAPSHQPQSPEQVRCHSSFQDGISENGKRLNAEGRLACEAGFERRLPVCPYSPSTPKVPEISVAGLDMAVSVSPVWSKQRTVRVHKAHETRGGHIKKARNAVGPLPRRYAGNGKIQRGSQETLSYHHAASVVPWIHNQPKEKRPLSSTGAGISGIHPKFQQDDYLSSISQAACLEEIGQKDDESEGDNHSRDSTDSWNDGSSPSGNSPSTPSLPTTGDNQIDSHQRWQVVRFQDTCRFQHEIGLGLVDTPCKLPQWSLSSDYPMGSYDRIGCLQEWLGSQLRGEEYRWSLDISQDNLSHQLPGVACGIFGPEIIRLAPKINHNSLTLGQCHSDYFSQQNGGHTFSIIIEASTGNLELVHREKITIHAEHLPGRFNVRADWESRHTTDSTDWMLHREIFLQLQAKLGPFTIDLFASRTNSQLPLYCSWKPDPEALAVDALSISWKDHYPYLFPPFALIPRCLNKLEEKEVTGLLIAPVWSNQVWFPLLLKSLIDFPILLPPIPDIVTNPQGLSHPLAIEGHLPLATWPVSGNPTIQKDFQKELSALSDNLGNRRLNQRTHVPGDNGIAGVLHKMLIRFQLL